MTVNPSTCKEVIRLPEVTLQASLAHVSRAGLLLLLYVSDLAKDGEEVAISTRAASFALSLHPQTVCQALSVVKAIGLVSVRPAHRKGWWQVRLFPAAVQPASTILRCQLSAHPGARDVSPRVSPTKAKVRKPAKQSEKAPTRRNPRPPRKG